MMMMTIFILSSKTKQTIAHVHAVIKYSPMTKTVTNFKMAHNVLDTGEIKPVQLGISFLSQFFSISTVPQNRRKATFFIKMFNVSNAN